MRFSGLLGIGFTDCASRLRFKDVTSFCLADVVSTNLELSDRIAGLPLSVLLEAEALLSDFSCPGSVREGFGSLGGCFPDLGARSMSLLSSELVPDSDVSLVESLSLALSLWLLSEEDALTLDFLLESTLESLSESLEESELES